MNNCIRTNLFSAFDCIWLLERLPQVSAQPEHTIVTEWLPCENWNHNNNRNYNYNTGHPQNSAKNKHPKTEQKQYILRLLHETKCYQEELYTTPYLAHQNQRKRLSFASKCVQNRIQRLHFVQGSLKRL